MGYWTARLRAHKLETRTFGCHTHPRWPRESATLSHAPRRPYALSAVYFGKSRRMR